MVSVLVVKWTTTEQCAYTTVNVKINMFFMNFSAHGQLTIRLLLDINETCLRSQGFFDLWKKQKKYENDSALATLATRLAELDALPDDRQRWIEIIRGALAGNFIFNLSIIK